MLKKSLLTVACCAVLGVSAPALAQDGTGALHFQANGEELATEGFKAPKLTKDGWAIKFSHIYMSLGDITAYQTSAPYAADKGGNIPVKSQVALPGTHVVDLVKGVNKNGLVDVGNVKAPAGHYSALPWKMVQADRGPAAGYTTVLIVKASKGGKTVDFQLVSDEVATYRCGEYVGDERKGFLKTGGKAEMELTFHLDHIFGSSKAAATDAMNTGARGFEPFAKGGKQALSLKNLHVGHTGEGHCNVQWH